MHPITPMMRSGRARLRCLSKPSWENTLSSHFSRMEHVFSRIRSASSGRSVSSYRCPLSNPATRSESYSFIWQP